ncbi:polysaccharide deacetylase family protein [Penicillium samsonianum]|uniref:polysaccharide deacetylase family protein n=1 Tax=Penicillium samsonianum TaxID=1882272 RepID=UPI002546E275|nr:polysaccharide deacetylase family protein [Penicillium samsonianum]KAJ6150542.1 polysaccharide deacetylase family protein [Penicillium samsonianum]
MQQAKNIRPKSPYIISVPMQVKLCSKRAYQRALVIEGIGTNSHPDNNLADYSSGFFAARVGVLRLLRMLKKLDIANRCTWFIPSHSVESFPDEIQQVVASGAEIGLHGYAHEGA